MTTISRERLKELLDYDAESGAFTWKVWHGGTTGPGVPAGNLRKDGRLMINVDGRRYLAHRLAWLYVYGRVPAKGMVIDHIRGQSNAIANLREVTQQVNTQNKQAAQRNNQIGVLGVNRIACGYRARIKPPGAKAIHLGVFKTAEEAHQAYVHAKRVFHQGGVL